MSQEEKLSIDQKIEIARMAVDLYSIEFNEGHKHQLREGAKPGAPLSREERDALYLDWKIQDIRTDFQHIYHSIESAILKMTDTE